MAGNDSQVKQVIIVRKDLNMNLGKIIAQCSHASLATLFNKNISENQNLMSIPLSDDEKQWIHHRFTKVVLEVKNENQLLQLYNDAVNENLNVSKITDAGFTTFEKPTLTCIAIGPNKNEEIDKITKKLQLLKYTRSESILRRRLKSFLKTVKDSSIISKIQEML